MPFSVFSPFFLTKKQAVFWAIQNYQCKRKIRLIQIEHDVPEENLKVLILQQDQFCPSKKR